MARVDRGHLSMTSAWSWMRHRGGLPLPRGARVEPATDRVRRDGKFFRLGSEKFYVKGVTYGPFAPNNHGEPLPDRVKFCATSPKCWSGGKLPAFITFLPNG